MRAKQFTEAALGTNPKRPARSGSRPARGHKEEPRYKNGISADQENKFHTELDDLVHKTFGHSTDEVKEDGDPCWDNYKQVGMKKKGGKKVPNCVPKESVSEARMSAAVKLQKAFQREQEKGEASRKRGEEVMAKAKKDAEKEKQGVAEGSSGVSVRQWANQVRKDHGNDVKFRNRQEGSGAVDSVIAKNSQGETVGVYNRKTGFPTVFEPKQGVAEGEVVAFPKKHKGDLEDTHDCPKCGGDLQGGTYMGHKVKVCMPCKQVYLPPNSGIDKHGNKVDEIAGAFPSPSTKAKWAADAAASNAAEAKRQEQLKAQQLQKNTELVDKEQKVNHHSLDATIPSNEGWFDSKPKVDFKVRAKELFAKGLTEQQVLQQLIKEGCPPNQAAVFVQGAQMETIGEELGLMEKATRALCTSSKPDEDLGASNLASCKSQGLRARDGDKSHKLGKSKKSRVKVGGHKIKGNKYGGPLPDWS